MPRASRSDVSYAKTDLSYPIFAADFDPYNRGYLVVGGGGGESSTGVPNQISVLDVSNRAQITTAAEIDLSHDEDSVQSLGNLATKDGLIVLAGVNASEKDQAAGKNEHFRSFEIKYPPRKRQKTYADAEKEVKGQSKALGKRSLFKPTGPKNEAYQRILRLSPSQRRESGSKRIGAVATSLAKESQIVVFNATSAIPTQEDILTSIDLPERAEANDLDSMEPAEAVFSIAYCTDYHLYEQTFNYNFSTKKTEKTPKGPRRVVATPDSSEIKARSKFRCLRFLNSENVIALLNLPNKSGAELRVFHLYPTGPAMLMQTKKLPSRIKQASSMDVCALDTDSNGNQQFVLAIAGADISIEVYTTNFQAATSTFTPFTSYMTMRDVHPQQMTKICFSPFHSPARASDSNGTEPATQYIRLASVSYGRTVVVDTLPLTPLDSTNTKSRYVLEHPSNAKWMKIAYVSVFSMIVLVTAFLLQAFGAGFTNDQAVGPFGFLPANVRSFLDEPAAAAYGKTRVEVATSAVKAAPTAVGRLQARLSKHSITPSSAPSSGAADGEGEKQKAVVMSAAPEQMGGVTVDIHPDREAYKQKDPKARHWHELSEEQKGRWKERLMRAGEWAEAEGEKVLLGVLFSEYAGLVGEGAAGMMREL
ncbi:uncharacterized protein LTR77_008433 [Saxophila tyrrhenica]|uniref:Guanine nucleotide-exchange factor SEC12 n=1 Tax=Saxophila tyrrhenica TaxID=1690608 RepID=A0AAV9P484_9PEZI|nr:hypothetical protein LTR77_008433 [Saxophila tyrrhenica]